MQKITALPSLPAQFAALALLQRLAAEVVPIMKKRGWVVQHFMEFLPSDDSLLGLNVNKGQEIKIRLRRKATDTTFLEYRDLVGTTLHELTHNKISPHDETFYKLLDELWGEYEHLESTGALPQPSGTLATASDGSGHALGGKAVRPSSLRDAAAVAAEKRARLSALASGSGSKLGGSSGTASRRMPTPQELRALRATAAERRRLDSTTCGCGHEPADVDLDAALAASLALEDSTAPSSAAAAAAVPVLASVSAPALASATTTAPVEAGLARALTPAATPTASAAPTRALGSAPASVPPVWASGPSALHTRATAAARAAIARNESLGSAKPPRVAPGPVGGVAGVGAGGAASVRGKFPELLNVDDSSDDDAAARRAGAWECPMCTLVNDARLRACDVCGFVKG